MRLKIEITGLIFGAAFAALAQPSTPQVDPLSEFLIAPELVMNHQHAIDLSQEQKNAIKTEIGHAQSTLNDLHWDLKDEMHEFSTLLSQDKVDEKKTLAQLSLVLDKETQIKKAQMTLMIRIKNFLTPEQQKILREIKSKME